VRATWTGSGGGIHVGTIDAPSEAPAGSILEIWVDGEADPTDAPITAAVAASHGAATGVLVFLGIVIAAVSGHLAVLRRIGRRRARRWEADWAVVEPLWTSRFQ
jgi:uncharacterized membrane protein